MKHTDRDQQGCLGLVGLALVTAASFIIGGEVCGGVALAAIGVMCLWEAARD